MKNTIISLVIFFILNIFIIFSINFVNNRCIYYENISNTLERNINNQLWDESYKISTEFLKNWESDSQIISVFVSHEYLDDINSELLKLTQYIKFKNENHSLAIIHNIKFSLNSITDFEKITIKNIF
ncbi:DUF4363 family protein [Clostridium aestuarii]|uniref:DUF4363 family protein n=1 Tax=Clostridium aestuarii TaxID=338193 RepID=A0ABT4CZ01_9CLOT|nr:DUF4363 family protein [Clostridium aestuarii]MCY6483190.1 DUF4363 family protein [Clostridium aestuarii]